MTGRIDSEAIEFSLVSIGSRAIVRGIRSSIRGGADVLQLDKEGH